MAALKYLVWWTRLEVNDGLIRILAKVMPGAIQNILKKMRTKILRRVEATEADILKTIVDYLEVNRILYVRIHPISPVSVMPHIRFRKPRPSQRGAPDLIIWPGGEGKHRTIAVEAKTFKGRQSKAQFDWELEAFKAGLPYCVVRSLEELLRVL